MQEVYVTPSQRENSRFSVLHRCVEHLCETLLTELRRLDLQGLLVLIHQARGDLLYIGTRI